MYNTLLLFFLIKLLPTLSIMFLLLISISTLIYFLISLLFIYFIISLIFIKFLNFFKLFQQFKVYMGFFFCAIPLFTLTSLKFFFTHNTLFFLTLKRFILKDLTKIITLLLPFFFMLSMKFTLIFLTLLCFKLSCLIYITYLQFTSVVYLAVFFLIRLFNSTYLDIKSHNLYRKFLLSIRSNLIWYPLFYLIISLSTIRTLVVLPSLSFLNLIVLKIQLILIFLKYPLLKFFILVYKFFLKFSLLSYYFIILMFSRIHAIYEAIESNYALEFIFYIIKEPLAFLCSVSIKFYFFIKFCIMNQFLHLSDLSLSDFYFFFFIVYFVV